MESAPPNTSKPPCASSILVVDDEPASSELVASLLKSQGYAIQVVSDGREALRIVAHGEIDLLVLDLMMSKLDGVEVCAYVRSELRDLLLPIIITTSLTDRESRIRAKEAGADDVLVKPIDGLELLVRIESLLRTRAHLLELRRERDHAIQELQFVRAQRAEARKSRAQLGLDPAAGSSTGTLTRVPESAKPENDTLESRGPLPSARK